MTPHEVDTNTTAVREEMDDVGKRVRVALRALMGARRVSARELGEALSLSPTAVYDRLNGGIRLSVEEAAGMAVVLGTTFDGLVEIACSGFGSQNLKILSLLAPLPGQLDLPLEEVESTLVLV